jgi:hypothetical protein
LGDLVGEAARIHEYVETHVRQPVMPVHAGKSRGFVDIRFAERIYHPENFALVVK